MRTEPAQSAQTSVRDRVRAQYAGERGEAYHRDKRSIPPSAYAWVARIRAEKIAPYVGPQDIVFEYGVGFGWNLSALECGRRLGCDVGAFLESTVRKQGVEFLHDSAAAADSSSDVVLCHHVLEHVLNPPEVLAECRRILRPGGVLLLYVPYEKERRYRRYNRGELNRHLYSWNVQTLAALAEQMEFEVVGGRVAMFSYDRFSSVWAERLRLGEFGYRLIRQLVHRLYPCLEVRVVARRPSAEQSDPRGSR